MADNYVSGSLYKIGGKIKEASRKEMNGVPEPEKKAEKTPLDAAYLERFKDFQRIRRDVNTRLQEQLEYIRASRDQLAARTSQLEQTLHALEAIQNKLEQIQEPDPEKENFKTELRETAHEYETARLEVIRMAAALSGSDIREQNSSNTKTLPLSEIPSSVLFSKGLSFFLPLGLWLLLCTILLSGAFILAWKVAL